MSPNSEFVLAMRYTTAGSKPEAKTMLFVPLGRVFAYLDGERVYTGLVLISEILGEGDKMGEAGGLHFILPSPDLDSSESHFGPATMSDKTRKHLQEFRQRLGFTVGRLGGGFTLAEVTRNFRNGQRRPMTSQEMEITKVSASPFTISETGSVVGGTALPVPLFSINNPIQSSP